MNGGRKLVTTVRRLVNTVPAALKALAALDKQIGSAKTYAEIRRIIDTAAAVKILFKEVDTVKDAAENAIIEANARLADELAGVDKATYKGGAKKQIHTAVKLVGRSDTGVPRMTRSRLGKLAKLGKDKRRAIVRQLQKSGKDATISAVLREVKNEGIQQRRAEHDKRAERGGKIEDLRALIASGKRFPVLYADPPWAFKVWGNAGKGHKGGLAENHYQTMTVEELAALPIGQLAAKNATLFMWCVWPELPGALAVLKAWGFEYKTAGFVWVKHTKLNADKLHYGMGYWTRSNSEVCLLATKGKPERVDADVEQVILAAVGRHSEKPEEARKRIQRLVLGPYFEAFGRRPAKGWWVWGAEQPAPKEQEAAE